MAREITGKAKRLVEIPRFLDPTMPLTGTMLKEYYVDRPSPVESFYRMLEGNEYGKLAIIGHKGSGKSTELLRLKSEYLDKSGRYNSVYINLEQYLNM